MLKCSAAIDRHYWCCFTLAHSLFSFRCHKMITSTITKSSIKEIWKFILHGYFYFKWREESFRVRTLSADQSDSVRKLTWTIMLPVLTYMYYYLPPISDTNASKRESMQCTPTHLKYHVGKRKSSKDEFKYKEVATTSYKIAEGKERT